jgi:hypothetical protein
MYELTLGIGLAPQIATEAVSVSNTLGVLGAVWLGVSAVLFLVIVPLAARRPEADVPTEMESRNAALRDAA